MKVVIKNRLMVTAALAQTNVAREFSVSMGKVLDTMAELFEEMLTNGEMPDVLMERFVGEFERLQQYDPSMLGQTIQQATKVLDEIRIDEA